MGYHTFCAYATALLIDLACTSSNLTATIILVVVPRQLIPLYRTAFADEHIMPAETHNVNHLFCNACAIALASPDSIEGARNTLDEISQDLAKDVPLRQQVGQSDPSIWPVLRQLWQIAAESQADERFENLVRKLIPSLARFTRNLVAAVPFNQVCAFENEPRITTLLFAYTSFCATQDESAFLTTLLLAQTVSNIVTSNEALLPRFWDAYMLVPEEKSVIIRMLASQDTRTILSALVLILNSINDSQERTLLFTTTPLGLRICITLLDRMVSLHDVEEVSDGGKAFEVGYGIFSKIINFGFLPDLYTSISVDDEIITPHQTVLLKLLDSHLQTSSLTIEMCQQLSPMIASTFFDLTEYVDHALVRALPPEQGSVSDPPSFLSAPSTPNTAMPPSTPATPLGHQYSYDFNEPAASNGQNGQHDGRPLSRPPSPPRELDMLLPQVCEALVLVTQCLITLALTSQDPKFDFPPRDNPKDFFNSATVEEGYGLVEALISLLRLLDRFLPRILFGKPVDLSSLQLPAGARHSEFLSTNGGAAREEMGEDQGPVRQGFAYLKRDMVRLLGILCWQNKSVQDRIRSCGGIPVVMNLCVVDERNPYLREHAIFALHNLLEGNDSNQTVVSQIRPIASNSLSPEDTTRSLSVPEL